MDCFPTRDALGGGEVCAQAVWRLGQAKSSHRNVCARPFVSMMLCSRRGWQINLREPGLNACAAGFPKMTLQNKLNVTVGELPVVHR